MKPDYGLKAQGVAHRLEPFGADGEYASQVLRAVVKYRRCCLSTDKSVQASKARREAEIELDTLLSSQQGEAKQGALI